MSKQSFNRQWRFTLGDPANARWGSIDDSSWRVLDLPHDWSIELDRAAEQPSNSSGGFFPNGRGWYRKSFAAPQEWLGKKVWVEFEGVYMNAEVWLNENFLGRHPYGYTSFALDLSPYLRLGEENALRVCVDNSAQLNSRWYSGSGIYRPVWLHVDEVLHTAQWGVSVTTPRATPAAAEVHVRTTLDCEAQTTGGVVTEGRAIEARLISRIIGPDGVVAGEVETHGMVPTGGEYEFAQQIEVHAPQLWSPETPALYRLQTEVWADGQQVQTTETTFGIRVLEISAEKGFLLNGQPLKMKGGCVHHDNGVMGAISLPHSEERKVALHKASGFNAIRCAHNPPAPAFLEACDRLGMLVIDEAFDCWREGKNPHDYHVVFDDWWERDLESMVQRDRNHPSVVVWSIGNEILERDGRSEGAQIARLLAEKIRALDPTRPITAAICGVWDGKRTWQDTDAIFAALDIGGYNYQWNQYQPDHQRQPERVMFGTESFPLEAFENWMAVLDNEYVIGDFVWTSMDYIGEAGIGRVAFEEPFTFLGGYPWHLAYCGDIDLAGFKRPQSYYRDVVWGVGEKLHIFTHVPAPQGKTGVVTRWGWPDVIASWNWPERAGQPLQVDVYSACEEVELLLNGQSLGKKPATRAEKYTATFEVPYAPGELRAVGYSDGRPCAEAALKTAGPPAGIHLCPEGGQRIAAQPEALCYVTVTVVDSQDVLQPDADLILTFTVEGSGEIAALGSGNPTSTDRYRGSQCKAFHGRCVVVLKSTGEPGEIRLTAQADGLPSEEVIITAAAL